jgi:hypothetical protein
MWEMDKSKILGVNNDEKKYMISAEEGPLNRDLEIHLISC